MKYKVGDRVKVKNEFDIYEEYRGKQFVIEECDSSDDTYLCHPETGGYRIWFSEEKLEPVAPTLEEITQRGLTCVIHTPNKEDAMCVVGKIPSGVHPTTSNDWLGYWDIYKENMCYYIVDGAIDSYSEKSYFENSSDYEREIPYTIYKFSDLFATGGYCNGFRGGKKPEYVLNEKQAKEYADNIMATSESISHITGISYEDSINKLKTWLGTLSNDGISAKNGGKNSMKFTFYVTEGYRIDKSNNTRIPTMTTEVLVNGKDYQYGGSATCDKADYSEREGVLNAIANAVCGGNFDREFTKVIKNKAFADKKARTCIYCGQLFDTVAEKDAHEAWHVERRKARHERYLLRKRAKEIAFEEQAQKMAKEMMNEKK